jgi:hypothetical protein
MPMPVTVSLCPLIAPAVTHHPERDPAASRTPSGLAYSFTVPGEPHSSAAARNAVSAALHAHGLAAIEQPALQVITELVTCGALFAPGQDLYYSIRWREGILRLVNWDPHSSHTNPADAATCTAGRKRTLLLLATIVRECAGTWGIAEPTPTTEGTKVWANLPETGARAYAARSR